MSQLPFEIPKSLASYAEHFKDDPIKATTRLKKQLKKRGPDAVGHFLLAWFYHLKGLDDNAVEEALKARIYAPGSPFFEKLHYYLSHPHTLEAWTPKSRPSSSLETSQNNEPGPVLDLDSLIQKLSAVESQRIKPNSDDIGKPSKKSDQTDDVDDIVTETLASIHEKQGKLQTAIRTYGRLKKLNADKKEYYDEQIRRLEQQLKQADNS